MTSDLVLTLYRDGRQCRAVLPAGQWDWFRSWFQKKSKNFLSSAPEKKVQKMMGKCICVCNFVQRLPEWQRAYIGEKHLKHF